MHFNIANLSSFPSYFRCFPKSKKFGGFQRVFSDYGKATFVKSLGGACSLIEPISIRKGKVDYLNFITAENSRNNTKRVTHSNSKIRSDDDDLNFMIAENPKNNT